MKRIKPTENNVIPTSQELATLDKRFEEFSAFAGEWLLLKGDQLLAHSQNYHDINAEIQKRGLTDCFVDYVPTCDERDFILI